MAADGYYLTPETADRVMDVVERVEADPRNVPPVKLPPRGRASNVQRLRVTAAGDGTLGGVTYRSARRQQWDAAAGAWVDAPGTADDDLWVFHPDGTELADDELVWAVQVGPVAPLVDDEPDEGPTFAVIAGGGAGAARVRPTGRPYVQDGVRYYPAVRDADDSDGPGFHDGVRVWLMQRDDAPLGTTGNSHYLSLRKLGALTVTTCDDEEEERELWCTTERIGVVRVDLEACLVTYSDTFEGDAICDFLTIDGDLVTIDGFLIGVD